MDQKLSSSIQRYQSSPGFFCSSSNSLQVRNVLDVLRYFVSIFVSLHFRQVSVCYLLYLLQQIVWSCTMVRYKNDVNNKLEVHDNFTEELIKYQNVSLDEIVKFGVNRFNLYKKMKYNVLALEV